MGVIKQSHWRIAGGVTTAFSALMAWYGVNHQFMAQSLTLFLGYWSVFGVFVIVTLYIVLLDLRYIRLQYKIEQRELFRQTWEDESFREELLKAKERKVKEQSE